MKLKISQEIIFSLIFILLYVNKYYYQRIKIEIFNLKQKLAAQDAKYGNTAIFATLELNGSLFLSLLQEKMYNSIWLIELKVKT